MSCASTGREWFMGGSCAVRWRQAECPSDCSCTHCVDSTYLCNILLDGRHHHLQCPVHPVMATPIPLAPHHGGRGVPWCATKQHCRISPSRTGAVGRYPSRRQNQILLTSYGCNSYTWVSCRMPCLWLHLTGGAAAGTTSHSSLGDSCTHSSPLLWQPAAGPSCTVCLACHYNPSPTLHLIATTSDSDLMLHTTPMQR